VLTISIKLKSKEVIRIKGVKLQFKNGYILLGLVFVQYRVRRLAEKNVYVLSEMTYFVSSKILSSVHYDIYNVVVLSREYEDAIVTAASAADACIARSRDVHLYWFTLIDAPTQQVGNVGHRLTHSDYRMQSVVNTD